MTFAMQIKEIQLQVGPDRYAEAVELANQSAADTGQAMPPTHALLWELPQEIGYILNQRGVSAAEALDLLFTLYEEMPCYGLLALLGDLYDEMDEEERVLLWARCTEFLDSAEERLVRPMEYFVWCDFFETGHRVEEAWQALVHLDTPHNALHSLLLISGPVPFDLKLPLYECLLPDPAWYQPIFLSLLHSQFEEHGQIEPQEAANILRQLHLPRGTPDLRKLQQSLGIRPALKIL